MKPRPNGFWIASGLFFLSGAGGLAYEVIWFKRFSHLWGSSTFAMAAVVSSFLVGLALGAEWGGRRADRAARPLRGYALCELGIGLLAIAVPFEILGLFRVAEALYPALESRPWLQMPVRMLLSFAVMGPPCFLMGATLPLMIRAFTTAGLSQWTGWFYGVNTLGAALGCFAAGFLLLPAIGLLWTNAIAAATNLLVAAAAWALARRVEPREAAPEAPKEDAKVLAAAALMGAASLMLQMVWARQLSVMVGGSTYAIATVVGVFLLGLGLGGLVLHALPRLASRTGDVILFLALTTMIGQALIPMLSEIAGGVRPLRTSLAGNGLVCAAAGAAIELLPTLAMGALFPMLAARLTGAGRAVGRLYACNTVGAIAGAMGTSALLVPLLGTAKTAGLALGLYAVAMVLLMPARPVASFLLRAAAGAGIVAWAFTARVDPKRTNLGMYLYGFSPEYFDRVSVLQFAEGRECNVLVTGKGGDVGLRVNGKVDASTHSDMATQLGIAYFTRFFVPDAKEVLVIGYGCGATAGASLLFPGTHVECVEIEPCVYAASSQFWRWNHSPDLQGNFTIRFDDGRAVVQGTRRTYDLLISEPSNLWIAGVSGLFTVEFYEAARRRLNPGGLLAQWVQTYAFAPEDFATIVRTVREAFPFACLVMIHETRGTDMVLLASDAPLTTRADAVRASQAIVDRSPLIEADLLRYYSSKDVAGLLLTYVVLDESGVERLLARGPDAAIHTDLNLQLEFDAPLRLFSDDRPARAEILRLVDRASHPIWAREAWKAWGCGADQTPALRRMTDLYVEREERDLAREVVALGLETDPLDARFLGRRIVLDRLTPDQILASVALMAGKDESEALGTAKSLMDLARNDDAACVLAGILAQRPHSVAAWVHAGMNLQAQGKKVEAKDAYQKALSIDPTNRQAIEAWEAARDKLK